MPNIVLDRLLPTLKDTELRLLLATIRLTSGWNRDGRPVYLPYRRIKQMTGRESAAISQALRSLAQKGLIHSTSSPTQKAVSKPKNPGSDFKEHIKTSS